MTTPTVRLTISYSNYNTPTPLNINTHKFGREMFMKIPPPPLFILFASASLQHQITTHNLASRTPKFLHFDFQLPTPPFHLFQWFSWVSYKTRLPNKLPLLSPLWFLGVSRKFTPWSPGCFQHQLPKNNPLGSLRILPPPRHSPEDENLPWLVGSWLGLLRRDL